MSFKHLLPFTLLLGACQGALAPPPPCGDAGPTPVQDASPGPVADAGAPDVAKPSCEQGGPLRIDSISPDRVTLPRNGDDSYTIVYMRGCGFDGVKDVEVNVYSVPFRVISNDAIAFTLPSREFNREAFVSDAEFNLPYRAQVDVIKIQPDQAQTFITFE